MTCKLCIFYMSLNIMNVHDKDDTSDSKNLNESLLEN
jgi:hypothetical protein